MTDRRTYAREYAARGRKRAWEATARTMTVCPHRQGPGRCGATLREVVVNGRVVVECPACDRRERGVCRDCPRPVEGQRGKAVRCAEHKDRARQAQSRRSAERHKDPARRRARTLLRAKLRDPEYRAQHLEKKRLWRIANPELVRASKRREALRQHASRFAYHRAYREARRAEKCAYARAAYYARHPDRPTPTCRDCGASIPWAPPGRPPTRCVACVSPSSAARRRQALPDWSPPAIAPAAPRTCLTPGCPTIVHGRAKKCEPCRTRAMVTARQQLAAFREAAHAA